MWLQKGKEGIMASNTNSLFPEEAAYESCQRRLMCCLGIVSPLGSCPWLKAPVPNKLQHLAETKLCRQNLLNTYDALSRKNGQLLPEPLGSHSLPNRWKVFQSFLPVMFINGLFSLLWLCLCDTMENTAGTNTH